MYNAPETGMTTTERAWKLFLLLTRMILSRPPRGVHVPKKTEFSAGQWAELVKASSSLFTRGTEDAARRRRRDHGDNVSKRPDRALREHSWTHVPFLNWCNACVLSRSKENPHRPRKLHERKHQDKTTIQLEHMFPWGDGACKVLTMTETTTGYTCAAMVLANGSADRYAVHASKQMIDEVGDPVANIEGAAVDLAQGKAR